MTSSESSQGSRLVLIYDSGSDNTIVNSLAFFDKDTYQRLQREKRFSIIGITKGGPVLWAKGEGRIFGQTAYFAPEAQMNVIGGSALICEMKATGKGFVELDFEGNRFIVGCIDGIVRVFQGAKSMTGKHHYIYTMPKPGERSFLATEWRTLMCASRDNDTASIERLWNMHEYIDGLNSNNMSALCIACNWANVEATRALLARGANVHLGMPPILAACELPHENVRARMDMCTFWARRLQVVRFLADHNANLNVVDTNGCTALMNANRYNQVAIIKFLLDEGVNIDVLNSNNESALCIACYWANVEATRLLLVRGAKVDLGDPPFEACISLHDDDQVDTDMSTFWARRSEIFRLLRDNVNARTLMSASRCNQVAIMKFLLDEGVNIDVLNSNNMSALCIACYRANVEATRLLLARGANVDLGDPPIEACISLHEEFKVDTDMSTFWARRSEIFRLLKDNVDARRRTVRNNQVRNVEPLLDRRVGFEAFEDDNGIIAPRGRGNVEVPRVPPARDANRPRLDRHVDAKAQNIITNRALSSNSDYLLPVFVALLFGLLFVFGLYSYQCLCARRGALIGEWRLG